MKKFLPSFAIAIFSLCLWSDSLFASHISGGEITYQCLGNNQYLITMNLFRDCCGIDMSNTQSVNISGCGNQNVTLNLVNSGGTEVSQLCSAQQSQSSCRPECQGNNCGFSPCNTYLPGMSQWTYQETVTLAPCANWTMSWTTCCRNTTVNVPTSDNDDFYIEATLNSVLDTCNSSPVITAQPIPYVCANQQVVYNWGAVENDGDSLVFSLVPGQETTTLNLVYANPYSGTNPINGITIDPATGQITFTPTTIGNFIVVILIQEYDSDGNLKGTIMRDIQFVVQSCSNNPPPGNQGVITGLTGTASQVNDYSIEMCDGGNFSFTVSFSDPDVTDTVTLTSNVTSILPGATFTTTPGNPATATISWSAPGGSVFFNSFTIFANDGACPVPGIQSSNYQVSVIPGTVASEDTVILCGTQAIQLGVIGGDNFVWSVISGDPMVIGTNFSCDSCPNPIAQPAFTTLYEVVSDLQTLNCVNRDTVEVRIVPDFTWTTSQSDTAICLLGSVQYIVTPDATDTAYYYQWSPVTFLNNDSIADPVASNINTPGINTFYVTIASSAGCVKQDTLSVLVSSAVQPNVSIFADTTICAGDSTQLFAVLQNTIPSSCGLSATGCTGAPSTVIVGTGTNTTTYPTPFTGFWHDGRIQMLYTASELNAMGFMGGQITGLSLDISSKASTQPYSGFTIKLGCTNLSALPSAYQTGLTTVYGGSSVNTVAGLNNFTFMNGYDWDGLSNIIVEICFDNTSYTQNDIVFQSNTTFNSVIYSYTDGASGCSLTSPTSSISRPNIRFSVCSGGAAGSIKYFWSPSIGLSDTTISNPWANPPSDTSYTLFVIDTIGGCSDTANVNLYMVPNFTYTKTQSDTAICRGGSVQFNVIPDTVQSYTYAWTPGVIFNDDSIADPIGTFDTSGTNVVYFEITSEGGCGKTDSMSVLVSVAAQPQVTIEGDSTICLGDSTQLNAVVGYQIPVACGLSTSSCSGNTSQVTIGTGTSTLSNTTYPAPYGNWYYGAKHQILFTASELQALGFSGGQITALTLNVASVSGATSYNNFEIRMGCTSLNALTTAFQSGLVTVFPAQNITVTSGLNTHTFASGFDWDGQSNIIVQICFNNTNYTNNSPTYYTSTSFNSVTYYNADNSTVCSNATGQTSTNRPNIIFTYCAGVPANLYSYSWTPGIWLSDSTISNPFASPQSDTTYLVTVTDTIGGCSDTASINVYLVSSFTYTKSQSDTAVCLNEQVQFEVVPDSSSPSYTYSWFPSAVFNADSISNPTGTFSTSGLNTVYVNITTESGCTKTDSFTVMVSTGVQPVITIIADTTMCAGDSTQLIAQNSGSGNNSCMYVIEMNDNFGDGWNGAMLEFYIDGILSGTFTFNAGIQSIDSISVTQGSALSINFTSGVFPFEESYIIYDADGNIVYQDGPAPQNGANIWSATADCGFVSSTSYSYSWSPSYALSDTAIFNPWASPSADTSYTVTVTDTIGGCSDTASINIYVVPAFTFTKSQSDTAICLEESVQFTVSPVEAGTYTYLWTPSTYLDNNTIANPVATITVSGNHTYYFTVSNGGGCEKTDSMTVVVSQGKVPDISILPFPDDTICEGNATQLTAQNSNGGMFPTYIFNWTPPATLSNSAIFNPDATPVTNTTYTVIVTDTVGTCGDTASIDIVVAPDFTYQKVQSDTAICLDELVQFLVIPNDIGTFNYQWTPSTFLNDATVSNPVASITAAGTYTYYFTISQFGGCEKNDSMTVVVSAGKVPDLSILASPDDSICEGNSIQLTAENSNGGLFGTYTYNWSPSDSLNSSTIYNPVATPIGNITYTVIVTDTVGFCADTVSIAISVAPTFNYQKTQSLITLCLGGIVEFSATPTDTGSYTYLWSPSIFLNSTTDSSVFAGPIMTPGTHIYYFTITNAGGCSVTDSMSVLVSNSPAPVVNITSTPNPICPGSSLQLNANVTGSSSYSFAWSGAFLSNGTIANPVASPTSTTIYTVTVTDIVGNCSSTASDTVIVVDPQITSPSGICNNGNSFSLNATPPGGTWSGGAYIDAAGTFNPSLASAGQDTVIYTVSGCVDTAYVTIYPAPSAPLVSSNAPYCAYSQIDALNALGSGGAITWYSDAALTDTLGLGSVITDINAGSSPFSVWATETSADGCVSFPALLTVDVVPLPVAAFSANPEQGFDPLTVSFTNATQPPAFNMYSWNFAGLDTSSAENPSFIFKDSGKYEVTLIVTDANGCKDTASITIIVEKETVLEIPNIFTPNGDGINDVFKIKNAAITDFHIAIFNRWGRKVFEETNINNSWDGKEQSSGVYYYVINAKDRQGNLITKDEIKGTVTLIRD